MFFLISLLFLKRDKSQRFKSQRTENVCFHNKSITMSSKLNLNLNWSAVLLDFSCLMEDVKYQELKVLNNSCQCSVSSAFDSLKKNVFMDYDKKCPLFKQELF